VTTVGSPQGLVGDWLLRGAGVSVVKSLELSSESVQPLALRRAAVVLFKLGALPLPSKQLALLP
jgi:hypothetical protein